jgi:phospholipase/carboxylesterase
VNPPGDNGGEPIWLELPAISAGAPGRLLVFLHGAGSRPEAFAPVALAWQLKFPGAVGAILQAPLPATGGGFDWYDGRGVAADRIARIDDAAREVARRVRLLQREAGLDAARTVLVGFSQGATVALQALRGDPDLSAIVVAYAARLSCPIRPDERIAASVHLVHGEHDTLVPLVHAQQALRGLRAAGADATLDIGTDDGHSIGQEGVIVGTSRVMQTIFRHRARPGRTGARVLH